MVNDKMVNIKSGETFEKVFLNEPNIDLHITQEAGSHVKIHLLYLPDKHSSLPCAGEELCSIGRPVVVRRTKQGGVVITQEGPGCSTEIYALAYLHDHESVTTETHVTHAVGGGTSNQLVKFVLADQSRGRFVGDLKIAPDAQKTDAHQTNRNLLLSEEAEMRTQPQLEIYADDVKATHGASTGQLDESALFYMQQRGIDKQKARQLLVNAFMKEVVETISDEKIKANILTFFEEDTF